ncbi:MAG: hypothetical protein RLZZ230_470 [Candidatus Parcubacteria bacterium]|jgi:dipeptidase E
MINKKLFLSGGGDALSAKEIDYLYGSLLGSGAKVLYLPIAQGELSSYEACLGWFRETYKEFDFEITMITDLSKCNSDYLNNFDSVYIGGGNTFYLLNVIKEAGFIKFLTDFINSGKVVYGGSAGAIILGKDIRTASLGNHPDLNEVGISDFSGLNVINSFTIHCHYNKDEYLELNQFAEDNAFNVLALSEESGLFIDGDEINFIGEVGRFTSGD